ncbi:hypothetical protein VUR80DRAFT_4602 [Thermomyces stellatus]
MQNDTPRVEATQAPTPTFLLVLPPGGCVDRPQATNPRIIRPAASDLRTPVRQRLSALCPRSHLTKPFYLWSPRRPVA